MAEEKPKEENPKQVVSVEEDDGVLDLGLSKPDILSAPLEVEEMPESSELQKRRQQTKSKLREFAGVEEGNTDKSGDSQGGGLMDIIRESGLSSRHLRFCCGGVFTILFLVGSVYGGLKGWEYYKNRPVVEDPVVETQPSSHELFDSQIEVGIKIGFEEAEKDQSTNVGEELGAGSGSREEYARFVEDFEKIFNILQVDVQDLIDQSSDRTLAVDKYLDELEALLNVANLHLRQLQREEENLVTKFKNLESTKTATESEFFEDISDLDGDSSVNSLDSFIDVSQEMVSIRANYRARLKLDDFYHDGITELELRIKDIQLNKEALVKGVQVVELQGSDLKLIIDGSEL